jgi:hypothetical protein
MTRPAFRLFLLCLIVGLGAPAAAQNTIPASPYAPGVNLEPGFPGQPAPRTPAGAPANPFPQNNGQPMALPEPKIEMQPQEKVVNVDTALAALMKDIGNFSAAGTMELWSTNANTLDVKRFPFILVVKDGRIRTELDLRNIPVDGPDDFFATLRQVGIHRIQTITLPQLTTVQVIFPHARSYVTLGLPFEDIPGMIRFTRQRFGPSQLNKKVYEKYNVSLNYNTGDRVPMEVWESNDKPGEPAYVKFNRGGSSVTVSLNTLRRGDVAEEFFKVPVEFQKYSDMGVMLQSVSARFEREKSGRQPRTSPLVVQPNPDGSFTPRPR